MSWEKFGEFVRREREAKEIGLREMAKMIGVSPTYLSKVERDEFRGQGQGDCAGDRMRASSAGGPRGVRPVRDYQAAPGGTGGSAANDQGLKH